MKKYIHIASPNQKKTKDYRKKQIKQGQTGRMTDGQADGKENCSDVRW